jgi:hypothetical protein
LFKRCHKCNRIDDERDAEGVDGISGYVCGPCISRMDGWNGVPHNELMRFLKTGRCASCDTMVQTMARQIAEDAHG